MQLSRFGFAPAFATAMTLCAYIGYAGEKIPITGHYGGYDKSDVIEVAENHLYITLLDHGTGYFLDPPNDNTPFQHASGPCRGTIELKDGVASGSGICIRTNPEGGKFLLTWAVSPDTENGINGTWEMEGIEGNALGWSGAGTWDPVLETGEGNYVETFAGWIQQE